LLVEFGRMHLLVAPRRSGLTVGRRSPQAFPLLGGTLEPERRRRSLIFGRSKDLDPKTGSSTGVKFLSRSSTVYHSGSVVAKVARERAITGGNRLKGIVVFVETVSVDQPRGDVQAGFARIVRMNDLSSR